MYTLCRQYNVTGSVNPIYFKIYILFKPRRLLLKRKKIPFSLQRTSVFIRCFAYLLLEEPCKVLRVFKAKFIRHLTD